MRITYSPDAVDKLKEIKAFSGTKVYKSIREGIKGLSTVPEKGIKVEKYIGIENPYRAIHIAKFYVFYRIDIKAKVIRITDIYNEREDFLRDMFGISLRTQESIDYWGE